MYFLDEFAPAALGFLAMALAGVLLVAVLDRGWIRWLRFRQPGDPVETPLFSGTDVFVTLILHLALLVVFGSFVELLISTGGGDDSPSPLRLVAARVAAITAAGAGACAFAFLTVGVRHGQPLSVLGFRSSPFANLAPTLLSVAASYVPILGIAQLVRVFLESATDRSFDEQPAVEIYREIASSGDLSALALLTLAPILVAPIAEEILFRGVCFGWLRARLGFLVASLVSSALFATWHASLVVAAPLFIVGLLLAWVYERTGSLWFAILWHAAFNSVSVMQLLAGAARA